MGVVAAGIFGKGQVGGGATGRIPFERIGPCSRNK